ncbi:hypothetical protein PPERSA_10843 [Pseudocohnilembus persalinus]|uniref:Uncharacterized protein n=1 Tax=Pseudocohnilembus persalinus TaxID=266149 RepID=A0A0V0QDU3_PSEPJ|nr:hypothetical protein PPERSA_10843 [Pseudocohnilembus persalinus]|eukprot:KRX00344.1 hypothetical protein PPERSA_10843 [Pseudocohnilembus persalinus]
MDYQVQQQREWERMRNYLDKNLDTQPGKLEAQRIVQEKKDKQLFDFQDRCESNIQELFQIVGALKSQQESQSTLKSLAIIKDEVKKLPQNLEPSEKQLKINNIEENHYIDKLDKFNKQNTQRIVEEFQLIDKKLKQLYDKSIKDLNDEIDDYDPNSYDDFMRQANNLKEYDLINQKYQDLVIQVNGSKRHFLYELNKLEQKHEKGENLTQKVFLEMNQANKIHRIKQDANLNEQYGHQIENLSKAIQQNNQYLVSSLKDTQDQLLRVKSILDPKNEIKSQINIESQKQNYVEENLNLKQIQKNINQNTNQKKQDKNIQDIHKQINENYLKANSNNTLKKSLKNKENLQKIQKSDSNQNLYNTRFDPNTLIQNKSQQPKYQNPLYNRQKPPNNFLQSLN